MSNAKIGECTLAELGQVSGGMDPNYKFCVGGPAGTGVYPLYVDCNPPTWGSIFGAWAQRGRDLAAGKTQF